MPRVPDRRLSYGENLEKARKIAKLVDKSPASKSIDQFEDSKSKRHGPVRIKKVKITHEYGYGKIWNIVRNISREE